MAPPDDEQKPSYRPTASPSDPPPRPSHIAEIGAMPAPTLESISARLDILITRQEVSGARLERIEDRWDGEITALRARGRELKAVADTLGTTAFKMTQARAIWSVVPSASRLTVLFAGSVVGSFLAAWLWLAMHGEPLIERVARAAQ